MHASIAMHVRTLAGLGLGALGHRLASRTAPLNLMIALTNRCTARCGHCDIPARGPEELSTAALLALIDEAKQLGTRRIGFWGGEPLLRPDLPALLERCRTHRIWTTIDTNGDLFPRRAHELGAVDHVLFSLDGGEASHDALRGRGAHRRVMAALDTASAHGFRFWTITVLTKDAIRDLDHVLSVAEHYGGRAAFQVLHHPAALDGGRGAAHLPDDADLRDALRTLRDAKARGRPVANSRFQLDLLLNWPDFTRERLPEAPAGTPRCLAGKLYANVDVDGSVYPCSLLTEAYPALRVADVGLERAFAAAGHAHCGACTATAFTEYNALFGLHPRAVAGWVRQLGVERAT